MRELKMVAEKQRKHCISIKEGQAHVKEWILIGIKSALVPRLETGGKQKLMDMMSSRKIEIILAKNFQNSTT